MTGHARTTADRPHVTPPIAGRVPKMSGVRAQKPAPEAFSGGQRFRIAGLTAALSLVSLLGLTGCADTDPLADVALSLRASDNPVRFPGVVVGGDVEQSFFVINDGDGPISLEEPPHFSDGDVDAFRVVSGGEFPLDIGGFTEVRLRFSPDAERNFASTLRFLATAEGVFLDVDVNGAGQAATIRFNPDALVFDDVSVGEESTNALVVENVGSTSENVIVNIDGHGFLFDDGGKRRTVSVAAGGSETLALRFIPDRGGAFSTTVTAEVCGSGCGPRATLSGNGIAPRIDVSPRSVDLGVASVGASSTVPVVIANTGVGGLMVTGLTLADAGGALSLSAADTPFIIDAGASTTIDVTYTPLDPDGNYVGTLIVDSTDPLQGRITVPVHAVTEGKTLRLLPGALHFGVIDDGASATADVLAVSTGTDTVTLTNVFVIGEGFALRAQPPSMPLTLASGESVILSVEATGHPAATTTGFATGEITVQSDVGDITSNLTFSSGTEGCQPRSEGNANLGYIRVGEGGQTSLVVENIGNGDCTVDSIGPPPGLPFDSGFSYTLPGSTTIPPGGNWLINFGYQASRSGQAKAFLELTFAEQPAPMLVSATATGVDGAMTAQPPTLTLGPVVEGCPGVDVQVISFVNSGADIVTIEAISFQPPIGAVTLDAVALPVEVAPGATFETVLRTTSATAGIAQTMLVATTLELGPVAAAITVQTESPNTVISESFEVADTDGAVDILFIIDDSGSMADDQAELAANFDAFITAAAAAGGIDFQIGVTSTDVITPGSLAGQLTGSPMVLTPQTPQLESIFAERANIGVEGSGAELGLEAMRLALSAPLLHGGNLGFHRPDAALSVIVVADEDDSGGIPWVADNFPEHARTVDSYVSFLAALKGGVLTEAPVLFSMVSVAEAYRYKALVQAFGGITLSITDPDWGEKLSEIADATFALQRLFRLGTAPQTGTVTVTVDGQTVTAFTVDEGGTVLLDDAPVAGAIVEIFYVPEC